MPLEPETKQLHPYKEERLYNTEKVKLNRIYSIPSPSVSSIGTIKSTINNLRMPELTIVQGSQAVQKQNIWNSSVSQRRRMGRAPASHVIASSLRFPCFTAAAIISALCHSHAITGSFLTVADVYLLVLFLICININESCRD